MAFYKKMAYYYANIIVVILFTIVGVATSQDFSSVMDVKSLNTLPLEALLNIKNNMLKLSANDSSDLNEDIPAPKETNPEALPFQIADNIKKKGSYYVHVVNDNHEKYEKKKTISKFFQLSVTSLAFLAFGGYLLFLIMAAIKGQNYNNIYDPNTTQIMQAMINTAINRRRRRRKKKPMKGHVTHFGYKEDESFEQFHKSRSKRHVLNNEGLQVEQMYQILVNVCEGYSKFAAEAK